LEGEKENRRRTNREVNPLFSSRPRISILFSLFPVKSSRCIVSSTYGFLYNGSGKNENRRNSVVLWLYLSLTEVSYLEFYLLYSSWIVHQMQFNIYFLLKFLLCTIQLDIDLSFPLYFLKGT